MPLKYSQYQLFIRHYKRTTIIRFPGILFRSLKSKYSLKGNILAQMTILKKFLLTKTINLLHLFNICTQVLRP